MSCRNQARKIDLEFWKELERETTEEFCQALLYIIKNFMVCRLLKGIILISTQVGGNIPVSPCDECHCLEPRKKYCMAR